MSNINGNRIDQNRTILASAIPHGTHKTNADMGCMLSGSEDRWTSLSPALLVSIEMGREEGEKVNVLCACSAIHANGLRLTLPCHLNMMPDDVLKMEVFLPNASMTASITAVICAISASNTDESIFYEIDTEFRQVSSTAMSDILAFLSDRTGTKRKSLPA